MEVGVLSSREIRELIKLKVIKSRASIEESQIQPASLDMRLGGKGYRVSASRLPSKSESMDDLVGKSLYEINLANGAVLEKDGKYLIELQESIDFDALNEKKITNFIGGEHSAGLDLNALKLQANSKSTSGKLHFEVKLVSHAGYDKAHTSHADRLFIEVTPKSFPIKVQKGLCLNQLRFCLGNTKVIDSELESQWNKTPFVFNESKPADKAKQYLDDGVMLSVNLNERIGFVARKDIETIIDLSRRHYYAPEEFFNELKLNKFNEVILRAGEFYIISTHEGVSVPLDYCGEMQAYALASGEFRSHYAGFFDPGWGYGKEGEIKGTPATLEVIPHDTLAIKHGHTICKIVYEKMHSIPERAYGRETGAPDHAQKGPTLAKQFKDWQ